MSDDGNVFDFHHYTDRLTPSDPPGPLDPLWEPPEGKSAREWCEEPDEQNVEILGPLVTEGARVVIGGASGHGKTSFVMGIVAAVARGTRFLNLDGCDGPVLIIDLEQGRRTLRRRLREAGLQTCDKVIVYRAPDGLDLNSPEQMDWLVQTISEGVARHPFRMVVLDPLYKAHAGDSTEERAMVDLMRKLDALREQHGFALIIPMHLRKINPLQKEPTMADIFGSAALCFGAETVLGLQRLGEESAFDAKLFFWKDRDGDLQELAGADHWNLMFDRTAGFRRGADDLPTQMSSGQKIMIFLTEAGIPMDKNAIKNATQLAKKTVDDWMPKLVAAGQVVESPHRGRDGRKMYGMADNAVVIQTDGETTVHALNADIESMGD